MKFISVLFLCLFISSGLFSQNKVQWRGPERDGIYPDKDLLKTWPEGGPQLVLELEDLGNGYSSAVLYKNTIYVCGRRDSLDVLSSYQMNGTKNWEKVYGRAWSRTYPETRCTPAIENDLIYLISGMGEVVCMNASDGAVRWKVDANKLYSGEPHTWGIAESPVVSDKAVFYVTGGSETSVVALDKTDGKLLWKTKSLGGTRAYASSLLIEKAGLRLLLAQTANDLLAVNIENGDIIWSYNLALHHTGRMGRGANTNTPIYANNEIFLTSGYDHPALLLTLADDAKSVSLKWTNPAFDSHIAGAVKIGDYVFGSTWITNGTGNWICADWKTGTTMYETTWFNKGPVIAADGMLYCYEEKTGNLALVKPNPEKFEIISSLKINKGTGPYWAHPTIYDGKLFVRHGTYLAVYNLRK